MRLVHRCRHTPPPPRLPRAPAQHRCCDTACLKGPIDAQLLKTTRVPLDKCFASTSQQHTWYVYECAADGQTFVQNSYTNANCTGNHTYYYGNTLECVENMGFTFSFFNCSDNSTNREWTKTLDIASEAFRSSLNAT